MRVRPDGRVHVACPGVEEDDAAGRDGAAFVGEGAGCGARQTQAEHGVVAQEFADEGDDVGDGLVVGGVAEGIGGFVDFADLSEGGGLDVGARGEESDGPGDEGGQAGGGLVGSGRKKKEELTYPILHSA